MTTNLEHQGDKPDNTESHVQAMCANQGKEGGQKATALRACTLMYQVCKFIQFKTDKTGTQQAGNT